MTLQVKYAVCLCVMCMAVFRAGNGSLCAEGFPNGDRIWVGTSDGVYIFDSKDESFVNLPILSDGEVRHNLLVYSLAADVAGNMWIGTLGDGLYRYNIKSGTFEHYTAARYPEAFSSDVIVKVLLDHDSNIWVASDGGSLLNRYNPENNRFSTFRVEDTLTREPISRISTMCQDSFSCNKPDDGESYGRVRSMIEYSPGVMMLGTDHGLVNFNAKYRSFEQVDNGITNRNGRLNDKFIHSILKDRDGGIWIGTYFGGINYLSPLSSLFTLIETGEGCGRIISKFCEGPGGNIWIGSDDGGLRCGISTGTARGSTISMSIRSTAIRGDSCGSVPRWAFVDMTMLRKPFRALSAWGITATWWTFARIRRDICGSHRWAKG